jgi:hypothetical protein
MKATCVLALAICLSVPGGICNASRPGRGGDSSFDHAVLEAKLIGEFVVESQTAAEPGERKIDSETVLRSVFRTVTFRSVELIKGELDGATLVLMFHGGRAADGGGSGPVMNTFEVGERVILFVAKDGGFCALVGCGAGQFVVDYDAEAGTEIVRRGGFAIMGYDAATRQITLEKEQVLTNVEGAPRRIPDTHSRVPVIVGKRTATGERVPYVPPAPKLTSIEDEPPPLSKEAFTNLIRSIVRRDATATQP